jgi:hypothetical protein
MNCNLLKDDDYIGIIQRADIRDSTKEPYISNLRTIIRHTGQPLCNVINNADVYYPVLKQKTNKVSTLLTLIKTILSIIKYSNIKQTYPDIFLKWYGYFKPLNEQIVKQRETNIPTYEQSLSKLDWEKDVMVKYKELEKKAFGSIEHLTLAIYTLLPPRRQRDYWKVVIIPAGTSDAEKSKMMEVDMSGYIDLSLKCPEIHIVAFKTNEYYKEWSKVLPDKFLKLLAINLRRYPRKYLFVTSSSSCYKNFKTFAIANNDMLKGIFGNKNVSVNSLRHSAATYVYYSRMTPLEKERYAYDMGHSVHMQRLYVQL